MRWFRSNIRFCVRLALIALAINLGLSFGHFHPIHSKIFGRGIAAVEASVASLDDGRNQGDPDGHADYLCPVCMAATAMASALASAPPALSLQLANVTIDPTIEPVLVRVEPPRAAFQSRGPPIS